MFTRNSLNRMNELDTETICNLAPSVMTEAHNNSKKYIQISTMVMINALRDSGWKPVMAGQKRSMKHENRAFTKHIIAFKKSEGSGWLKIGDDLYPEIILTNSHDGKNAYQLQAGLFRSLCSNGLVVCDSSFNKIRIRHMGFDPAMAVKASYEILDSVPQIANKVGQFQQIELSEPEKIAYSRAALIAKYDPQTEDEINGLNPERALTVRRSADRNNSLWTTFNVVQENLIKGGIYDRKNKNNRAREIKSIDKNLSINKALWKLTEEMAKIKMDN